MMSKYTLSSAEALEAMQSGATVESVWGSVRMLKGGKIVDSAQPITQRIIVSSPAYWAKCMSDHKYRIVPKAAESATDAENATPDPWTPEGGATQTHLEGAPELTTPLRQPLLEAHARHLETLGTLQLANSRIGELKAALKAALKAWREINDELRKELGDELDAHKVTAGELERETMAARRSSELADDLEAEAHCLNNTITALVARLAEKE